jgi:hypothetical protein
MHSDAKKRRYALLFAAGDLQALCQYEMIDKN